MKPHVVLITIDTLRKDYLGFFGYPAETSPFLDQMFKEGLVYKNTITPLPLTSASHATILTGLHPVTHQLLANSNPLSQKVQTMAEVFQKNGYYTAGTVAVGLLRKKYHFDQGFDSFSDEWKSHKHIKQNLRWMRVGQSVNESVFNQINEYLEKHKDKPLFLWVHYYDPHHPFEDWPHIDLKVDSKGNHHIPLYVKEIRYTDDHIRELYAFLKEKKLTETMVSCITADHGEQLGDHGFSGRHPDFYSENTHVPLLFHGYGVDGEEAIENYVSSMDIAPTLLGLANMSFDNPVHGINLLDKDHEPKPVPRRDFYIVGNPDYVRSMQLIREGFSFILNYDRYYRNWFAGVDLPLPGEELKPVPQTGISTRRIRKKGKNLLMLSCPSRLRLGLEYGVLCFDVKQGDNVSLGYTINNRKLLTLEGLDKKKPKTVTAFFPLTPLDAFTAVIDKREDLQVENFRYGYISPEEFSRYKEGLEEKKSHIHGQLATLRKSLDTDEFYNLGPDLAMVKNLLPREWEKYKKKISLFKDRITDLYRFYIRERFRVFKSKDAPKSKEMTNKEKKMLESLGYL